MIQRIQSIYLLLAAILMAVTAFSPLYHVGSHTVLSFGIKEEETLIKPIWDIGSFCIISSILSFVSIFMFKNRKMQNRVASISALFIVFFYATTMHMLSFYDNLNKTITSFGYGVTLPIIALVFVFLAKHKIKKDDKLVRSLDRIR